MPLLMAAAGRIAVERGDRAAVAHHLLGNHPAMVCMVQDFISIRHLVDIVRDDHFRLRYVGELSS
jgi:hypothetical protein